MAAARPQLRQRNANVTSHLLTLTIIAITKQPSLEGTVTEFLFRPILYKKLGSKWEAET
jgi:hypothetical protein